MVSKRKTVINITFAFFVGTKSILLREFCDSLLVRNLDATDALKFHSGFLKFYRVTKGVRGLELP